jgi:hypothetical protein
MSLWLRRFLPRLRDQLNLGAGVLAIGALLLGGAGVLANGVWRTALVASCVLLTIGIVGLAMKRAWPPRVLRVLEVEGQELPLADLAKIEPRVPALGILGVGVVGKTTLKNRLLQIPARGLTRTQRVTIHVSSLLRDPTTYFAFVDGGGDSNSQQFDVADHSNILVVLLDHDDIGGATQPNDDRLRAHVEFGKQLRDHLTNHSDRRGPIHVLLNKRDLWEQADSDSRQALLAFFTEEAGLWKAAFGDEVTSAEYSNDVPDDLANLIATIKQQWQNLQTAY